MGILPARILEWAAIHNMTRTELLVYALITGVNVVIKKFQITLKSNILYVHSFIRLLSPNPVTFIFCPYFTPIFQITTFFYSRHEQCNYAK